MYLFHRQAISLIFSNKSSVRQSPLRAAWSSRRVKILILKGYVTSCVRRAGNICRLNSVPDTTAPRLPGSCVKLHLTCQFLHEFRSGIIGVGPKNWTVLDLNLSPVRHRPELQS